MVHTNNNVTYYINPAYLTFVEDTGYGANFIQVSASSSCYIRVFVPGVIEYDADGNYRSWKITAHNNKFPDDSAFYIYVRLERKGPSALVVYSKVLYNEDGSSVDGSVEASDTYYYIRIGEVSSTNGTSIREISYDTGRLESDQVKNEGTELNEMWELSKFSTPWLIRAKQWLSSFTVKGFITLVGGLVFNNGDEQKSIIDVKRSTDTDDDVAISDETIPTTQYVNNQLEELDEKYLRKDKDDTAKGVITFEDQIKSHDFAQGNLMGAGWSIYRDGNGNVVVETDRMIIRKDLSVSELIVNQETFQKGSTIYVKGGCTIIRVEETETYYRCYFDNKDGEEFSGFVVGDQARCQRYDKSYQNVIKYYWRLVVGVGDDYVDLSKIDADGTGLPTEGDDIAQLGNRTDKTRQSAVVISPDSGGSVVIWAGINSFDLSEKNMIGMGVDVSTGEAYFYGYGNMYIGDRDKTSYIQYIKDSGLEIHAKKILLSASASLDDKLNELDQELSDMDTSILDMGGKVDGMGDTVNEIDGTVGELSNQVGNLDKKVTNLGLSVESTNKVVDTINRNMADISGQLDGSIKIWQGDYSSLEDILIANKVPPSSDWTTDALMNEHLGDYLVLENGMCYELEYDMENYRYIWKTVSDKYLIAYLRSLDKKKAIFKITDDSLPMTFFSKKEYAIGDLWVNATYPESGEVYNDETLVCITPKSETEQFDITHWVPADGTKKKLLDAGINIENREIQFTAEQFKFRNLLGELFAVLEEIEGVPTIRAELLQITGALIAEKIMASGLDIDGKFVVDVVDGKASVKLSGAFESAASGQRITIDPETGCLTMNNSQGYETLKLLFDFEGDDDYGQVVVRRYVSGELAYSTTISPTRMDVTNHTNGTRASMTSSGVHLSDVGYNEVMHVMLRQASSGTAVTKINSSLWPTYEQAEMGDVYLDSGTLKVKV